MKKPYVILANPKSGSDDEYAKQFYLSGAAGVLNCDVHGLDTSSRQEFIDCATELKKYFECLVIAGGDGTFSDALNSGDNKNTIFAYLPLGTGNALASALEYNTLKPQNLSIIAEKIKTGEDHHIDTILCETENITCKGLMAGVGLDARMIHKSEKYRKSGKSSLTAYTLATLSSIFIPHPKNTYTVDIDGEINIVPEMISFLVTKHPFGGYKLKLNPTAELDSRFLHGLAFSGGIPQIAKMFLTSFNKGTIFGGNTTGKHYCGETITISTPEPTHLQIDGNYITQATDFKFKVLKKNLLLRY
jgi:diacylglycerol kinase family enzyme